jgi:hypothetical protein
MCLRGASALQSVLDDYESGSLIVLVVWEPVLPTDIAPPTTATLGLVRDPRAIQYWDASRALSIDLVKSMMENPERYGVDDRDFTPETVVWDAVAVFPAGTLWERDLPVPAFMDFPVAQSVDGLRATLASQL